LFPNAIVIQRSSEADLVQEPSHTAADLDPLGKLCANSHYDVSVGCATSQTTSDHHARAGF